MSNSCLFKHTLLAIIIIVTLKNCHSIFIFDSMPLLLLLWNEFLIIIKFKDTIIHLVYTSQFIYH